MAEYVPPRYNDPNYLGYDDFEKQLIKRGIVESYYEQAVTEAAGEAYIKAANQQAFRYSEARRAVADALGTRHVIPAADTVVPQSAPGVISSTGAKAIASAAGSTGAQSARVLKTAAAETVEQLTRNPRTVAGAIPIVGAAAAAILETAGSRNAGRSWGESVSRGIGSAAGGTIGGNFGLAVGAASGFNPVPTAALAIGGAVGGDRAGASLGSAVWNNLRRPWVIAALPGLPFPLPMPSTPWLAPALKFPLPNLFGREDKGDDLPAYNPAGKQQTEDETAPPAFTGGQMPVPYQIDWNYNYGNGPRPTSYGYIDGPLHLSTALEPGDDSSGCAAGTSFKRYTMIGASLSINLASGCGASISGLTVTRADGQPDTGGNPAGEIATRPQPAVRPNSPIYNPTPAQPSNTPPGSNPATPNAPTSPDDLEDKTKPLIPSVSPAGSPAPSPIPPSTADPVTPTGSPSTVPAKSSGTNPARSGSASGATDTPEVDTNKDTDTIKINNPEGSNQIFKIPGYPDLKPGETVEIEDTEGNRAIARAIYAALAGVVVGGGVIAAKKVADLNKTSTTPVEPPSPPPPQNPTDTGCRCNSPVLSRLDEFEKKLGLNNIASGAGDLSVMAYLQKMQAFAEKAWEMSRIQKVLNALTLITVLHNASMVSRDVGETLGYALAQGLDVLGIEDEKGQTLDVNNWFGKQANKFFEGIFGAETWKGLNATWNKANRIISSASAIIWTIRSINDGMAEVMEWTAENTGKIGNALKKWGVVGEKAYKPMAERVKAQDLMRRKTARFMDGLESAENIASSFATATSTVKEVQDEATELTEQVNAFAELVGYAPDRKNVAKPDENTQIATANEAAATNAKAGPAVAATDMEPGTNGTP